MSDLHDGLKALGQGSTTYSYGPPDPTVLERFRNPNENTSSGSVLGVVIDTSEFTSLCPKTGQPDWARIIIRYIPDKWCVESKSLKLYLMGFRNHGEFHESCVQRILDDLVALLSPAWMCVEGRFTARGGISFWPVAIFNPAADHVRQIDRELGERMAQMSSVEGRTLHGGRGDG